MISCAEAVRRLWEYVEQDLDALTRERVDAHLALCRRCCGEAEFTARLRGLLGSVPAPPMPEDVSANLNAFLQDLDARR